MSDKHHRHYKHSKFRQNPRGDPKFLVDLTWNDPSANYAITLTRLLYSCSYQTFDKGVTSVTQAHTPYTQRTTYTPCTQRTTYNLRL